MGPGLYHVPVRARRDQEHAGTQKPATTARRGLSLYEFRRAGQPAVSGSYATLIDAKVEQSQPARRGRQGINRSDRRLLSSV